MFSASQWIATAGSAFWNVIRRVERALLLRGPLAQNSTAQILNALLLGISAWSVLLFAVDLPTDPNKLATGALETLLCLNGVAALVLLHKGALRAASLVYLCGSWVVFTVLIIFNGGIHSVAVVYYVVIPTSAAWLLGYRAALGSAAICLASSLTMAVMEINGFHFPLYFPGRPLGIWDALVGALVLSAVPVARVLQILNGALKALLQQQDHLEERTAELRESEERFRNVADTAPVMIWVADTGRNCTFLNSCWLEFTGRTLEQELGRGWETSLHPDDIARTIDTVSLAFNKRARFSIEYRLRRADGEYRNMLCSGVPRFQPEDVFLGYIGSCVDVTEIKQMQEKALAHQKLESLGVLASGIAHDFNNLLGGILASTELAETEHDGGSHLNEELQRIKSATIRGSEIVRQLMVYAGSENPSFELVDISCAVEEVLQLLQISVSKQAVLQTEFAKNLSAIWGNAAQIRSIVMNLVINASEAIGEKPGNIKVRTSQLSIDPHLGANLATGVRGDYVRIEISDTGCGMSEEMQTKAFDPFYSTKFAGRGLGLAVVQGVVRAHGGFIRLESSVGRGTSFQILLPCANKQAEQKGEIVVPTSGEGIAILEEMILLVEDEQALRTAVSAMLRKTGFKVVEAANGNEAIDEFHKHSDDVSLMLLDVTIPGTPSRQVMEEVHRIQPGVKIILTSAHSQEAVMSPDQKPLCSAFIRKPFHLAELVRLVRDTASSS